MEVPGEDLHRCLAILILRTQGSSQDDVAGYLKHHKSLVSMVERWFSNELKLSEAVAVCEDIALKQAVYLFLVPSEQIGHEEVMKASQLTAADILRHYRKDYVAERVKDGVKKVNSKPMELHLSQLAHVSEILAHQVNRLVRYKDDNNIEVTGDVFGHLSFWAKTDGMKIREGTATFEEFEYEKKHPIDLYLAKCLYLHYEDKFGKMPFKTWKDLSTPNATGKIVEKLKLLAHGGLKICPNCPICREITK